MDRDKELAEARKVVAQVDWRLTPFRELAYLINEAASAQKQTLRDNDFSGHEFACGKTVGYLTALEDILRLPAEVRGSTPEPKAKGKRTVKA